MKTSVNEVLLMVDEKTAQKVAALAKEGIGPSVSPESFPSDPL